MYLTNNGIFLFLSILIVSCLSNEPDNVLFSSVAEMSKLAKLELSAVSQMEKLRHLIDQRLARRADEWSGTEDISKVQEEVTQIFDNLPPPSELEGAGNGGFIQKISKHFLPLSILSFDVRPVPPPGDIQAQRDRVQRRRGGAPRVREVLRGARPRGCGHTLYQQDSLQQVQTPIYFSDLKIGIGSWFIIIQFQYFISTTEKAAEKL